MPKQNRGKSNQYYETPNNFIKAVERKFGPIIFDLAASNYNTKSSSYFTEEQDSLEQDWTKLPTNGNLWLNPPYSDIGLFAKKCNDTISKIVATKCHSKISILMLVPASVGSNWFRDYVYEKSIIFFLNGRITFVGEKNPYPKDCMLCQYIDYSDDVSKLTTCIWHWNHSKKMMTKAIEDFKSKSKDIIDSYR